MQKNRHLGTITQLCRSVSSQLRHVSTVGKKHVKQQYLFHMFPQYGELRPTSGWDRLAGYRHPSKFQRLSRVAFVTAATSVNGSQPNFARCLAVSCADIDYLYIFGGCCPVTEFCQVQNSLCVLQVLHSLRLAALLHGTRALGASQTLRCWAHGATYIQQGDHDVGHWRTF